ncbi:hypothetical protein NL676_023321 [Syzygium grande]|nr:hypothetical protein NL676_023321 [Syzygium grande]
MLSTGSLRKTHQLTIFFCSSDDVTLAKFLGGRRGNQRDRVKSTQSTFPRSFSEGSGHVSSGGRRRAARRCGAAFDTNIRLALSEAAACPDPATIPKAHLSRHPSFTKESVAY